mmetsp:Transcript_63458/g.161014  ORF Transcript_63458/g.161014 Transcript_63458/m.161014 type:complete len:317 (+) Transcript_63458:60-1010(+)
MAQPAGGDVGRVAALSAAARLTLSFMVELGEGEPPRRFRVAPGKRPVKVGRGPKNDIVLTLNGISAHHLDILALEGADGPTLAVRDVSMNGSCIVSAPGGAPLKLAKDMEIEVLECAVLLLPFKVKPDGDKKPEELRQTLRITVLGRSVPEVVADPSRTSEKRKSGDGHEVAPRKAAKTSSKAAEEMMARCRAFAEEMERKKREQPPEPEEPPPPAPSALPPPPARAPAPPAPAPAPPMAPSAPGLGMLSGFLSGALSGARGGASTGYGAGGMAAMMAGQHGAMGPMPGVMMGAPMPIQPGQLRMPTLPLPLPPWR